MSRVLNQQLKPDRIRSAGLFRLDLAGFCRSANGVGGGDFYEVLPLKEGSLLLGMADVMGSGEAAAVFASRARDLAREVARETTAPGELLKRLNQRLFAELSGAEKFITAQWARLERGTLTVASAGHCAMLLTDGAGTVRSISPEGLPLGILPDAVYEEQVIQLSAGHRVLLHTDGLSEARSPEGDMFGQARLEAWLSRAACAEKSASELHDELLAELRAFQGGIPPEDDETFVIVGANALTPAALALCGATNGSVRPRPQLEESRTA